MTYEFSKEQKLIWLKNEMRSTRNLKLMQSDYTQLIDAPLTDSKKIEWATYRQELRDLPATVTDINDDRTISFTWPTEPSNG